VISKQFKIIFVIIVCFTIVTGCSRNVEMPTLKTIIDNKEYSTITTSYYWEPLPKKDRLFGTMPYERLKSEEPTLIRDNKVVKLEFNRLPENYFVVLYNNDNENYDQIELKVENSITIPDKAGVYYYAINTTWKEGQIKYGFCVKIE